MRRCCSRRPAGVLALAVAPVVAFALTGSSAPAAEPFSPSSQITLTALSNIVVRPVERSTTITALPLQSPSVNGFQPFVVFGLTDENDDDFFSPPSETPGSPSVPNPARYFIGTLDSGSSAHIMGFADSDNLLFPAGLEGTNTVDLSGAGGTIEARVSDALGFYISGLGNATAGVNGPVVPTNTLKGTTNTPILTIDDPPAPGQPAIPNIIGAPAFAYYQVAMLNSQTQRLTVNGQTYQGPHIELREKTSHPGVGFAKVELEPIMPGGAIDPVVFQFDPLESPWSDNPVGPAVWNGLYTKPSEGGGVDLTRGGNSASDLQFLFDTGAQVSVLSKSVANQLGISTNPGNETPPDFTVEVLGVGGIEIVPGYLVDSLGLLTDLGGNTNWTNVPVLVADLPDPRDGVGVVPGILGMNLFNDRDLIINGTADLENSWFGFSINPLQPRWTANAGGNWGDNANWFVGVPSTAEAPANFTASTATPQTINVEANYTLGTMKFDSPGTYMIGGTGRLTFETVVGPSIIEVANGNHIVNAPVTLLNDTVFTVGPAGATLRVSDLTTAPTADLSKIGAGTASVNRVRAQSLSVNGGTMRILPNGASSGVSNVGALTVNAAAGAKLDLTDNDIVVRNGSLGTWSALTTAYTDVTGLIDAGRGNSPNAQWNGTGGIVTSDTRAVNQNDLTTLGVATGAQVKGLPLNATALWNGQTVTATDVLVMFTWGGDANLDGKINIDDYGQIDFNVGSSGSVFGWFAGDFNYDGKINIDDYGIIDFNVSAQTGSLASGAGLDGIAAVPEPSAACLLAAGAIPLLRRRRRRILATVS